MCINDQTLCVSYFNFLCDKSNEFPVPSLMLERGEFELSAESDIRKNYNNNLDCINGIIVRVYKTNMHTLKWIKDN